MLGERLAVLLGVDHAGGGRAEPVACPRRLGALVHPPREPAPRGGAGAAYVARAQRRGLVAGEHGRGAGAARQRREQAALQMDHVGCEAFGDVAGQRVERRERVAGPAGPRLPPAAERHRLDARRTLGQPGALRRRVAAAGGRDDGHGVAIDEAVDELRRRQTRGVVARQGRQP